MVVGGLFNAFAFAGAGSLFSHLNKRGYEDEIKRHNKATEKLAAEDSAWRKEDIRRKDKFERLRIEAADAERNMKVTNKALDRLRGMVMTAEDELEQHIRKKPELSDFYKPSDEFVAYERAAVGLAGVAGGWGAYKLYRVARDR
jgi:hypothetical protein